MYETFINNTSLTCRSTIYFKTCIYSTATKFYFSTINSRIRMINNKINITVNDSRFTLLYLDLEQKSESKDYNKRSHWYDLDFMWVGIIDLVVSKSKSRYTSWSHVDPWISVSIVIKLKKLPLFQIIALLIVVHTWFYALTTELYSYITRELCNKMSCNFHYLIL